MKLRGRAPEGKILTAEEVEKIGYEWGLLKRTDISELERGVPIGECCLCGYVGGINHDDTCPVCGADL